MSECLYKILEVPETASIDDIKKAYRKLSLKYHPDKNQNDPSCNEKFSKISSAYETLGDLDKKQQYDSMKTNPFAKMMQGNRGPFVDPVQEIFSNLFGMGGMGGMGQGMSQGFQEGNPFGMNFGPNVQIFRNGVPVQMQMQKPQPIIKSIIINMEQVLTGANIPVEIERWIQESQTRIIESETLYIPIPKGIDDNELIILRDKGNVVSEACKGDIKLFVKVVNNTDLKRQGLDLILNKKISLKESLCGFSFEFKYVNNKVYTINNNLNNIIPPGHNKIIPNMGLTRDGHTGNLIIVFDVEFPTKIDEEVIKYLQLHL